MAQARRHHYVSQFYLKRFSANPSKPRLFVADFIEGKSFRADPKNVAFEKDFHTIDVPGQAPDAVETALSQVEGDVAAALRHIIESSSLSDEKSRAQLFYFATLLLIKNPAHRAVMNSVLTQLMTRIAREEASHEESFLRRIDEMIAKGDMAPDTDVEELRRSLLAESFEVSMGTEAHLDMELSNVRELQGYLLDRKWHLYRATDGHFVTSDRPVTLMWADPRRRDPIGVGLLETRVLFPLSSTVAICGGFELQDAVIDVGAEDVAKINGRTILNANRQIYARGSDFTYALQHNAGPRLGSELLSDEFAIDRAQRANGDPFAAAKARVTVR